MTDTIFTATDRPKIGRLEISEAMATLRKYKDGKQALESRIVANEQWWRLRQWDEINRTGTGRVVDKDGKPVNVDRVQPTSAWLYNSLANKHADIMDNYPSPVVLPRERMDEPDAKSLSAILPVIMERVGFERVYSDNSWDKIKHGTAAYGVFWDSAAENGLGDISVKPIDILNLFWEPGVNDLQDSQNLFVVALRDNNALEAEYPVLAGKLGGSVMDIKEYRLDDAIDTSDKSLVVDWYYKRMGGNGKTVLHLCKFVDDTVLFASENDQQYADRGIYDHGKYPVFLDVLLPQKGSPAGWGYIDIMRDPQMYIDKLNQILIENAYLTGKPRFFIKDNGGVNEEEFADWKRDFVHVAGGLNEDNIRQIKVDALPGYVSNMLDYKVNELKETSGNRDFTQGGTASGVTAASAIAALQEAGNKLSRDMIKGSYRTFRDITYLCIELIRQFYDEEREFRITGQQGETEFTSYSNAHIRPQTLPPDYAGQEMEPGYMPGMRMPIFDVVVKAEKTNPFSRASQNEMAKEFYSLGFFDPTRADMALAALDMMDFDGKDKVVQRISQGQTLLHVIQQQREQMDKMAMIIQSVTGANLLGDAGQAQPTATGGSGQPTQSTEAKVMQSAADNANTSYAERLAARASVDMGQ